MTAAVINPVLVARMDRAYRSALRAEEGASTLTQAWRLAAVSQRCLRELRAALAGQPVPARRVPPERFARARRAFAALATIGTAIARAVASQARAALRRVVRAIITQITTTAPEGAREHVMGIKYLSITTTDGASFRLRVTRETPVLVAGIEVERDGDEIVPRGGYHNRLRIVPRAAIRRSRELRMNVRYCQLEPIDGAESHDRGDQHTQDDDCAGSIVERNYDRQAEQLVVGSYTVYGWSQSSKNAAKMAAEAADRRPGARVTIATNITVHTPKARGKAVSP